MKIFKISVNYKCRTDKNPPILSQKYQNFTKTDKKNGEARPFKETPRVLFGIGGLKIFMCAGSFPSADGIPKKTVRSGTVFLEKRKGSSIRSLGLRFLFPKEVPQEVPLLRSSPFLLYSPAGLSFPSRTWFRR